jgi:hypothetical protein
VSASQTDVIQIVESEAELWADQRVSRWVEFTRYAVGLEAKDASSDEVNIVSPPCHNWVAFD